MVKKDIIDKHFRKLFSTEFPELWEKMDDSSRDKLADKFTQDVSEQVNDMERSLSIIRERTENSVTFIYGIIIGLVGGVVGSIINTYLEKFGVIYQIVAVLLFVGMIWFFIKYIQSENQATHDSNELLVRWNKLAEKELERR